MKTKLTLIAIALLAIAPFANAVNVVSVQAYDISLSGGRLGTSVADALHAGDAIGIKLVVQRIPFISGGTAYPAYDGAFVSSIDFSLTPDAGGVIADQLLGPAFAPSSVTSLLSPFSWTASATGVSQMTGVSLDGVSYGSLIVDGFKFTANGAVSLTTLDLAINGLSEYLAASSATGAQYLSMTNADLGDLAVHQIPEPITVALMGLGGLFVARKKK